MKKFLTLTFAIQFCIVLWSQAPLLKEEFIYGNTAGDLNAMNANWVRQNGTGVLDYRVQGQRVGDHPNNGGSAEIGSINSQKLQRNFTTIVNSGAVYVSFIAKINSVSGGTGAASFFGLAQASSIFGGPYDQILVRNSTTAGKINFGLLMKPSAIINWSANNYDKNVPYQFVLKHNFLSNNIASLFIFDSLNAMPATEPASPTITHAPGASFNITNNIGSVVLINPDPAPPGDKNNIIIDKIVATTTWASNFINLPIKFSKLHGVNLNNSHLITWKAFCTDPSNTSFEVEHSIDGVHFNTIATISASVNLCNSEFNYTNFVIKEKNFYRIKGIEFDKKYYSSILSIHSKNNESFRIEENPVLNKQIKIVYTNDRPNRMVIEILNTQGKSLYQHTIQANRGTGTLNIDASNFSSGLYIIKMNQETQRVIL